MKAGPVVTRAAEDSLLIAGLSSEQLESIVDGAALRLNNPKGGEAAARKDGRCVVMVKERMVQIDGLCEDVVAAALEGRPVVLNPESFYQPRF